MEQGHSERSYQARCLDIRVDRPFEDFRRQYEQAVPPYDAGAFNALVARGAPWDDVLALMRERAPHDFLIYWSSGDLQPMMKLAGDPLHCVEYLMGNHTTAERMFRHDPAAMLYAPLRVVICDGPQGGARFVIEQPSRPFGSFGVDAIHEVSLDLDREVAALLAHLQVPVPAGLSG
ncbi:hypothetical protein [Micromonospora parathelypteridis]|uniref:DUF302 domain-containing protein n=1 Tax=Micromonospora parathelypteridis TaxID=1839617 RepID=A0A840VRD5_9ACTN|nr:hypothetical protein [Micromonospora parathelypteridis]MBB5475608.1 hypothetical protein [Micromonospora parathelypteridis]GGO27409.1 hypothetical protein GCM10011576_52090 [Micromonospora parathelypteridis]